MEENAKYFINEALDFFKPSDNDDDTIKNLKIENSGTFLFVILTNLFNDGDKIKSIVLNKFETYEKIYADIVSSQINSNCSCRSRVIKYFSKNIEKIYKTLLDIINENTLSEATYNNIYESVKSQIIAYEQQFLLNDSSLENDPKYIAGQIWEIEDNPIEYSKTIKTLKESGLVYKGLSIIKINNTLKLYFY